MVFIGDNGNRNMIKRLSALVVSLMMVFSLGGTLSVGQPVFAQETVSSIGSTASGADFDFSHMKIEEVNVCADFNADNTAFATADKQIQAALDTAKANSRKGITTKVIIPKGTYLLSSSLVVYSDTWIYCEEGAELKRCSPFGSLLKTDPNGIGGYDGVQNIILEGGEWNGNTAEYPSLAEFSNLRFAHCRNLLLKDVHVSNNADGHHVEIGGAADVTIEGCVFTGYSGELKKEAIQLDCMNSEEVFAGYAPFDDTACENVVIKDNLFSGICRGLGSHSVTVGVYYKNILIEGNTFENLSGTAMIMYNYQDCTIQNNTLTNCASGIEFKSMSRLPDSNFHAPAQGSMDSAMANVVSDANSVITGNTISTNATDDNGYTCGIMLAGYEVSGSEVIPDYDFCITGVEISENRIESTGTTLVINDAANCVIDSNVLICSHDGVNFKDKNNVSITDSNELVITDNLVSDSARSGILLSNSSFNTISGNTVANANYNGINIFSGSASNKLIGNTVYNPQKNGISVSADSAALIEGNTITNAAENGISVYCYSDADCKNNIISASGGHGIAYNLDTSGEIVANNVAYSQRDGVTVTNHSEDVDVKANSISGSAGNGVSVSGYTAKDIEVVKNTIDTTGRNGISVSSNSSAEIKDNTLKNVSALALMKSENSTITLSKVTEVKAVSVTKDAVKLSYSGGSTNKCGYEIYRKVGSQSWKKLGDTAALTYSDGTVLGQNTYYYKVRCYETVGGKKIYGDYSDPYKVQSAKVSKLANTAISGIPEKKVWTGKAIVPNVVIKNEGKKLVSGKDYTVKCSANKAVGTAKVVITGQGNYSGSVTKTFKIVPQGQSITVKAGKTDEKSETFTAAVALKKHSSNTGYQILYADNSGFKNYKSVWITDCKKASAEIKKLAVGKVWYFKARDYKTVGKTKWYGEWSGVKTVKVEKVEKSEKKAEK